MSDAIKAVRSLSLNTDQFQNTGTLLNPNVAFATNPRVDSNFIIESGFRLEFHDPTDTYSTNIKAGNQTLDITLKLPTTAPSDGQMLIAIGGPPTNVTLGWRNFMTGPGTTVNGQVPFFSGTNGFVLDVLAGFKVDPALVSLVFGDNNVVTNGERAVILAGANNTIDSTGGDLFIVGGTGNQLTSLSSAGICGGKTNLVSGDQSIAIGGESNTVSGSNSYGLGFKSLVAHDYSFVFSDHSNISTGLETTAAGQYLLQATGGFGFVSAAMTLTSFPNNFINIYADTGANRAKLQYKNNAGTVSTTILDVLQVKGDLYTFNSTTNDRLGVGTNGQILSANSATTTGLEWINNTPSGVTSISSGSNIVCTPNPIVSTGTVALSTTPSGLTSLGVGNFTFSSSTITTAVSSLNLSSVDGRVLFNTGGGNPGVGLFFNTGGFYASIGASASATGNMAFTLPATHTTNGLLVNTGSGVLAETITPSGLTSIGVGNLTLSGDTITGTNGVLIQSTGSGQAIGLSPKGAAQVRIFSQDASNAVPLRFYNSASTQYIEFKAGTLSGNTTWTWPTADAAGAWVSDGAGATSFTASPSIYRAIVSVSGTSKTFALSDANTFQQCTNGSTVTLTVDTNANVAFPVGTEIDIFQEGAGQVVIAAAGGVTIESAFSNLKIAVQYGGATLKKLATNTWCLVGNLTA
jgi:hypothetical protein